MSVDGSTRVSVVIPVHDDDRFLGEAIDSVLAQGHPALELLVVDDGSSDPIAPRLSERASQLRCLRQEHAGPGAARNHGVAVARGELIAFIDADDLWPPGKLALQLEHLARHDDCDLVFGMVEQFPGPATPQPGFVAGALLTRRAVFDQVGDFSVDLRAGEVIDWISRARDLGLREACVQEVVLRRRIHDRNMTRINKAAQADYLKVVRRTLLRRRTPTAGG